MNAKIAHNGKLQIERGGIMKTQLCPHISINEWITDGKACGDWCPLFGEPEEHMQRVDDPNDLVYRPNAVWEKSGKTELHICRTYLQLDVLTDERGKE